MEGISPTNLAARAGISISYASQIIGGKRTPARPLAIHIFRKTGWAHDLIAHLTEEQMATLEAVEPWVAPGKKKEAA